MNSITSAIADATANNLSLLALNRKNIMKEHKPPRDINKYPDNPYIVI